MAGGKGVHQYGHTKTILAKCPIMATDSEVKGHTDTDVALMSYWGRIDTYESSQT
jgi:hypothetical protein